MSMISLEQMARELRSLTAAVIYTHKKPDGDAIGSSFAFCLALRSAGIKCAVRCHDSVPPQYRYLTDQVKQDEMPEEYSAIAVDVAAPKRLGKYASVPVGICIDHHENNTIECAAKYVEEDSSSCAEIILKLLEEMNLPVTGLIANLLYVGLVTDTQCFRTPGTNAQSLKTAAKLADYGADVAEIARRHCLLKSMQRMEIERVLMNSFHFTADGMILGSFFANDDMRRIGVGDDELEGLNSVVDQVEGIRIGIVVRETAPGFCRVSVRSQDPRCDASAICAVFGGGGHADRSGCEIQASPQEALAAVEKASLEHMRSRE